MPTTAAESLLGTATDERILDVSEQLFAQQGIAGVSLRSITIAAEVNIAAIHYHFGSKDKLVAALLYRRLREVNQARGELLDALDQAPRVTIRDVAGMWIDPLAALALDPERRAYLGFLVALINSDDDGRRLITKAFAPHFDRIDHALSRALPDVEAPVRHLRFTLANVMATQALADLERAGGLWPMTDYAFSPTELVEYILDAFCALINGAPK